MKQLCFALLILSLFSTAHAAIDKADWTLKSGTLNYHVHFAVKNVLGTSQSAKGKGHCDDKVCEFLVAAPVKSFDSGDGNRDNHMIEVTKGALNPMVIVKVQFPKSSDLKAIVAKADVTFAGQTHTYSDIKILGSQSGNITNVKGTIPMVLSHFNVERPSLLTVKIADEVPIDFDLNWE